METSSSRSLHGKGPNGCGIGGRNSARSHSMRMRSRSCSGFSEAVDKLWALHTEQLASDRKATEDNTGVWGRSQPERRTKNAWKEAIRGQGVFGTEAQTASPYRRLKLAMDYWCALWFWPLEAPVDPPKRDDFMNEVSLVLTGGRAPGRHGTQPVGVPVR